MVKRYACGILTDKHFSNLCEFEGFQSGVLENSGLLGCDAVLQGKWLPTFQRNVSPSSTRFQGA